jgi:hypothetical protein
MNDWMPLNVTVPAALNEAVPDPSEAVTDVPPGSALKSRVFALPAPSNVTPEAVPGLNVVVALPVTATVGFELTETPVQPAGELPSNVIE